MKSILLLVVGALSPFFALAGTAVNLSDALDRHTVKMDAVMTAGKYTGRVLRLTITNTGGAAIQLKVNTGMVLKPANPQYQQLLLPGGETLALKPHETGNVDVEVFCFNAVMACPVEGIHYTYFRMCGDVMMKVVEYVGAHSYFDHLGQAAVWSISNYLALNCVYDANRPEESQKLTDHINAVTRRPKPTYYTTYSDYEVPGQRAYVGKAEMIYVPFEVELPSPKAVTFAVYTAKGEFVKTVSDPQMVMAGKHAITAELVATDFPTGKYSVRAMRGEQVLSERTVLIEQPWITFKD